MFSPLRVGVAPQWIRERKGPGDGDCAALLLALDRCAHLVGGQSFGVGQDHHVDEIVRPCGRRRGVTPMHFVHGRDFVGQCISCRIEWDRGHSGEAVEFDDGAWRHVLRGEQVLTLRRDVEFRGRYALVGQHVGQRAFVHARSVGTGEGEVKPAVLVGLGGCGAVQRSR